MCPTWLIEVRGATWPYSLLVVQNLTSVLDLPSCVVASNIYMTQDIPRQFAGNSHDLLIENNAVGNYEQAHLFVRRQLACERR